MRPLPLSPPRSAPASRALSLAAGLLLLTLAACGSEETPAAAIGAACSANDQCQSGWCFTDPTFPGAYCSLQCKSGEQGCPEGSVCHAYQGNYSFCMKGCAADGDCREGYVCDYNVCRPKCSTASTCQGDDACLAGRCKAACKTDAECGGNKRCQDGKCLPPCKGDGECLPGFACDAASGQCKGKPGKKMGEACSTDGQCATGHCLPTTRVCSVTCASNAICPTGYVCALERLDKDGSGSFDGAEAACVPVKGKGTMGQSCQKDADCRSNHCYYGFCMEGCTVDGDCGAAGHCVQVNLLLGGAIPTFKGCLPRQGTSIYTLGTFTNSQYRGFDLPQGTSSFVLTSEVTSISDVAAVAELKDPTGGVLNQMVDQCKSWSQPIRYTPDSQISTFYAPNTGSTKLKAGLYTYAITGTNSSLPVTVKLQLKLGTAQKGTLNLNWVFLDLAGTCIPGDTLNAASAPNHAWFAKLRSNLGAILKKAGIKVGKESFHDLKDASLNVLDLSTYSNLSKLFGSSKGFTNAAANIFLVRNIKANTMGGIVLGISGGIPGPPALHGTAHSGVAMSMQTACYEKYGYNPAHTMAHELGHFLGLYHNVEQATYPGLDTKTGKVVCPCPCGNNTTCYVQPGPFGSQWCRGKDPIADTDDGSDNLMYYAAENTDNFSGNKLSPGQIRVMLDNPLVGF